MLVDIGLNRKMAYEEEDFLKLFGEVQEKDQVVAALQSPTPKKPTLLSFIKKILKNRPRSKA